MTDLNNSNLLDLDTNLTNQENNNMDTNLTTEPVDTLENMIATAETLRNAAEQAQIAYEDHLAAIARDHGATVTVNGQVYQIRHRSQSRANETVTFSGKVTPQTGREITYLCALKAEPKTWLKGRTKGTKVKKGKVMPAVEVEAVMHSAVTSFLPETELVSETGGATVIE